MYCATQVACNVIYIEALSYVREVMCVRGIVVCKRGIDI